MQTAPSQQLIFRAVFGAVKNAADGHPDWPLDATIARSIAKRATGTLTTLCGSDVLAARAPSERAGRVHTPRPARVFGAARHGGACPARAKGASRREAVKAVGRRSQLRLLHNAVGFLAGEAKRAGKVDRAEAMIDVLRLIAKARETA